MSLINNLAEFDKNHVWHPYASMKSPLPTYQIESADGVRLRMANGKELIDGMSSWWSVIHGYNNPEIINAVETQLKKLPHVMFGGLTHSPAIELAKELISLLPKNLNKVFFSDSGSVSVEVALKMAIQYHFAKGKKEKKRFITFRGGYHGDTFGAMSVCDPVTGMHGMFRGSLIKNIFLDRPKCKFEDDWKDEYFKTLQEDIEYNAEDCAAVIVEPIVQGAGGMRFYNPEYLRKLRKICDKNNLLLIFDEIATGFGRTGKMFALEHAAIVPDIICVGKALTGGTTSMAATITSKDVAETISSTESGCLMHGPTFMANPLACSAALASLNILKTEKWKKQVSGIENILKDELFKAKGHCKVLDVRVLGAIGVIELIEEVDLKTITEYFVKKGVWLRPFGKLIYIMPPYVISEKDLKEITRVMLSSLNSF